jgi:hypothetical protein
MPLLAGAALAQNSGVPSAAPRQPGELSDREKFHYRILDTLALRGLIGSAFGAGYGQLLNSPKEWGEGGEGYGKRYASSFAGALTRQSVNFGLEAVLNEDPRYFPLDGQSKKARLLHALHEAVFTHTDSGGTSFAYARVTSAFATGQIERAWQPNSTGSFSKGVARGAISLGVDAGINVMYEFVRFIRPRLIRQSHN